MKKLVFAAGVVVGFFATAFYIIVVEEVLEGLQRQRENANEY